MNRILLTCILFFISYISFGQTFSRIDQLIGLGSAVNSNGIAVADYDNDNDIDLFVVAVEKDVEGDDRTRSKLFRNNNDGSYTDVTAESGLVDLLPSEDLNPDYDVFKGLNGFKFGVSWGDYDSDGYQDIVFTHLAFVKLFRNQGDGTFIEVTEQAGIDRRNECGNMGATWFDFNNDSHLDLYVAEWDECSYNTLYINNGDGSFTDVSSTIIEEDETFTASYTPFPFDFNDDGLMDLYLSNDLYGANQLFLNNEDHQFEQVADSYGLDNGSHDMGIGISDYNMDGHFDFFTTAIEENFLFTNQGNGNFIENAVDNNIGRTGWAWGNTFADFDLDNDEDLIIVNGFYIPSRGPEPNIYFDNVYNQNPEAFEEKIVGIEGFGSSVTVIDFDYDNDGDLDVVISNSDDDLFFYENKIINDPYDPNNIRQWLKVSLEGTISNRNAIGTTLELLTSEATIKRYHSGVNMLGQSVKPMHFGISPNSEIISLKVSWPSGLEETYDDIDTNTFLKLVEGQGLEVLDNNYADKPEGCTDPESCNYNPLAIINDGSCIYLNVTGSINGPSSSGYLKEESYSFSLSNDQQINWGIEGGEILSDANQSTIRVKWGIQQQGSLTVSISDANCSSQEIGKNVSLNVDQVPSNVSIARIWNEMTLYNIRNDFARPTVHARNLFHSSAAMYDIWAILNKKETYLIGNEINGFTSDFTDFPVNQANLEEDLKAAISYASYRLLRHRFSNSPHVQDIYNRLNTLMNQLGYPMQYSDIEYANGNAADLGNYVAQQYIAFGLTDGSREMQQYENAYYQPVNAPLAPVLDGNPTITDPNHWQSLSLDTYIDQSGNVIEGSSIDFLSPEWGNVYPFALTEDDQIIYNRGGNNYKVFNDPGEPPYIGSGTLSDEAYKWGFSLVSVWSSHLDPNDDVVWDISPNSIGNLDIEEFPESYNTFSQFYDLENGGTINQGHTQNPITGQSYAEQIVPRGDYTRVLAEYWADGPDSETPPGHWFTILNNMVNDSDLLIRRFNGEGDVLEPVEWDIKAYFTLGGAMHDAAVSAWSIKGWYDYIRPISAIRYMADMGQSSDMALPNYHSDGIPLFEGFIEIVEEGDPLEGRDKQNIGKIKLRAWRGHSFIHDTEIDQAGVDWILAEKWWPYQRPSFVTPPFAGYVSGHSTYSRAAAEVLTLITGDEFFPGGMGEFHARKNEFLVFEQGPSQDVTLQWATYRDASDQCSLSRIWGGIHPPADDIPGRFIGEKIGKKAYEKAISYFNEIEEPIDPGAPTTEMVLYPNIVSNSGQLTLLNSTENLNFFLYDSMGRSFGIDHQFDASSRTSTIQFYNLSPGLYILSSQIRDWKIIVQ